MAKLKSRRGGGTLVTGSQRRGGCGCLSNGSRLPIPPVPRALPARRGGDPGRRRGSPVWPVPLPARPEHRPGGLPEGKPHSRRARRTRAPPGHGRPLFPPSSPLSPPLSSAPSLRCGGRKNPSRPAQRTQVDSHSGRKERPPHWDPAGRSPPATEVTGRPSGERAPSAAPDPRPAAAA